jgi:hypothetical protein
MPISTRDLILDALTNDWSTFVDHFQNLSPEEQTIYLNRQGYIRFADLLAHLIAWWEECSIAIPKMLDEPTFQSPTYDVNAFNAKAVKRFSALDEKTVTRSFELMRQTLSDLVSNLPDAAFQREDICRRLYIEIIGHLKEHQ